jgi:hypothetical protein
VPLQPVAKCSVSFPFQHRILVNLLVAGKDRFLTEAGGEGADALTDGTPGACAKRGASTLLEWMRNAATAAMRAPTATAVRPAQAGSRLRAVLMPKRTAASMSRNPTTAPPGGSELATYVPPSPCQLCLCLW